MIGKKQGVTALLAAGLLASVSWPAMAGEVTQERLNNADAEPANWLTVGQNYSSQRFSRLDQINQDNVGQLQVAFSVSISPSIVNGAASGMQVTPLVDDGVMYFNDGYGVMYAIDVSQGNRGIVLWRTDAEVDKEAELGNFAWQRNRGPALYGNNVYANLVDGRVVAYDKETGEIVWDSQIARTVLGYEDIPGGPDPVMFIGGEGFTAAPLAAEGLILVGQSKGDWGTRGYLAAVDSVTGVEAWRTYSVPGPGEAGHETWEDDHNAWRTGGAALWTTGSYDPNTRLTIWGTANPVPMYDPTFRPGDNLFTNSALAFDIDTGSIEWYFQYVPNEYFDYDENGVHFLYDTEIDGNTRTVVGHFARNGFFYQLDRQDGEFLNANQYVRDVNWTAGIDEKTGLPVEYDATRALQEYAIHIEPNGQRVLHCPGLPGGIRWQPPAYNPSTGIAYAFGLDSCGVLGLGLAEPLGPLGGNPNGPAGVFQGGGGVGDRPEGAYQEGAVWAVDVTTSEVIARISTTWENRAGGLATAGGLVFTGNQDGSVVALNEDTLETMWTFYAGAGFQAPPISYSVDGRQYIAIIASNGNAGPNPERGIMQVDAQLWVFALPQ